MQEHRTRCPDVKVTKALHLQTKIQIVAGDLEQRFVHTAGFQIERRADHHAGRADRAGILVDLQTLQIAAAGGGLTDERAAGWTA